MLPAQLPPGSALLVAVGVAREAKARRFVTTMMSQRLSPPTRRMKSTLPPKRLL